MEKTIWETEEFEMKNKADNEKLKSLSTRRHYAVAILQACGVPVEANAHTMEAIKRVEAVLTAYKTNRGKIL